MVSCPVCFPAVVFCFSPVVYCSGLVVFYSALGGSCHACSTLGGSCHACSALGGSCHACSALGGSGPVRSALVGSTALHFHMDLALRPSPCSASTPLPSWIIWGGGGYVTNPGNELLFINHQRSLTHHIDFHTTHTVTDHSKTAFPIIHCTNTAVRTDHAHT